VSSDCPSCHQPLIPYHCSAVSFLRCWGGHGVWIDNTLSAQLAQGDFPGDVVTELSKLEAHSPLRNEAHAAGPCPECAEPMQTFFVEVGQVAVDVCEHHGTWLDTGELGRIARGEKAPPPPPQAPFSLPSEEERRENTRRLEALVSAPSESTYAKGLRVMPGAIALAIAESLEEPSELEQDRAHYHWDGADRQHDIISLVFECVRKLFTNRD
jgi:Zn-finger nucleic acid-binding protein